LLEIYNAEPSPVIRKQQAVLNDSIKSLDERNAAYTAIRGEEERRLNAAYDFTTVEGIEAIPVPCKEVNGGSATGRVEHYLRGACFMSHVKAGNADVAVACIRKAHDLMFISDMIWNYDAFISSVSWLHSIGKHDEAWEEERRIDGHFQKVGFYPKLTRRDFPNAKSYQAWKENIKRMESERLRRRDIRHEYYWVQEYLPLLCPKSISGYSRMKNANSKNYQKLVAEAAKLDKQL